MFSSLFTSKVCDVPIELGEAGSQVMISENTTMDAEALLFIVPSNANDGPYGIEVCDDASPSDLSTWYELVDSLGVAVILPSPTKAVILSPIAFPSWRIKPTQIASERTVFKLFKTHR